MKNSSHVPLRDDTLGLFIGTMPHYRTSGPHWMADIWIHAYLD